jgi:hypothetical protein
VGSRTLGVRVEGQELILRLGQARLDLRCFPQVVESQR